jgi:hypothetical protein
MNEGQEDLDDLAVQIREVYWRERARFRKKFDPSVSGSGAPDVPRWDGGTDANGRRHKPVWPKIAAYFLQKHLPVEGTIRAFFDNVLGSEPPPPNLLLGVKIPALVAAHPAEVMAKLQRAYDSDRSQAKVFFANTRRFTSLSDEQIARLTIYTSDAVISPLFRYSLALTSGNTDLAHDYVEEGFQQYQDYPDVYEQIYGVDVMDRFRERYDRMKRAAS